MALGACMRKFIALNPVMYRVRAKRLKIGGDARQTAVRADPYIAAVIFEDAVNGVVRQSILGPNSKKTMLSGLQEV